MYHPGKDRAPREAALFDNCIITNLKGSAKFYNDIPIPNNFKFEEKRKNLIKINNLIYSIFNNYSKELNKMDKYKKKILNEHKVETQQVINFLKLIKS